MPVQCANRAVIFTAGAPTGAALPPLGLSVLFCLLPKTSHTGKLVRRFELAACVSPGGCLTHCGMGLITDRVNQPLRDLCLKAVVQVVSLRLHSFLPACRLSFTVSGVANETSPKVKRAAE